MARKFKKKIKVFLFLIILLFIALYIIKFIETDKEYILGITSNNDKIIIDVLNDKISCILSTNTPTINDKWVKSENNKCYLNYQNNSNLYIKINNKIINESENVINYININDKDTIYLPLNDKFKYINMFIGDKNNIKINNLDENVAILDNEGYINSKKEGTTTIKLQYDDKINEVNIVVTNLITKRPKKFDHNKEKLGCNVISKEENDLIDKILKDKIDNVGYKTRAAVVEAARFLTLDFSYKISYFYENGRVTTNNVDGEGRYYHVGLYLNESRFSEISGSSEGPEIWGCDLYSNPIKKIDTNGLDCSGFVSWALLNAGFDIGDIGAGIKYGPKNDLTDFGDLIELDSFDDTINAKVGDLLHSSHSGGHIAMIVGIENNNYYIAQALWNNAPYELTQRYSLSHYVQITKYSKEDMIDTFDELILMDKYYVEDGNLTNMW